MSLLCSASACTFAVAGPLLDDPNARAVLPPGFTLQRLHIPAASRTAAVAVELDGRRVTLELEASTVRAPEFRVLVQDADDALREVHAPPPRTCRGTVTEMPGSIVGGSIHQGRLSAAIALADGRTFYVQPAGGTFAGAELLHEVYPANTVEAEGVCPVDEPPAVVSRVDARRRVVGPPLTADLVLDADYELFQRNNSSIDSTVQDMESIINAVNVAFERDCNISHQITTILVRSLAADPYTSTSPGTLLNELGDYWNTHQPGLVRDVVHLMTGKELDGGTIGIAWVGAVCNKNRAYGLSQTHWVAHFGGRTALTAHELGHNWNAVHCNQAAQCNIMCSTINSCDGFGLPTFEPQGAVAIQAFAASRSCLSSSPTSVGATAVGGQIDLAPPHPSPFAKETQLRYYLELPGLVSLGIYDVTGQRVARLADGIEASGWHSRVWNGRGSRGKRLSPGVFYVRLEAFGETSVQRVTLVR